MYNLVLVNCFTWVQTDGHLGTPDGVEVPRDRLAGHIILR